MNKVYETLELSKARTMLLQSMLNWPWPCTIFCFRFAWVRKLVAHNLIEGFDWLSSRKKVCFVQGQGQKYGQKQETKELVQFHNHLHALTMAKYHAFYRYYHDQVIKPPDYEALLFDHKLKLNNNQE